jgi:hypothetical protein
MGKKPIQLRGEGEKRKKNKNVERWEWETRREKKKKKKKEKREKKVIRVGKRKCCQKKKSHGVAVWHCWTSISLLFLLCLIFATKSLARFILRAIG